MRAATNKWIEAIRGKYFSNWHRLRLEPDLLFFSFKCRDNLFGFLINSFYFQSIEFKGWIIIRCRYLSDKLTLIVFGRDYPLHHSILWNRNMPLMELVHAYRPSSVELLSYWKHPPLFAHFYQSVEILEWEHHHLLRFWKRTQVHQSRVNLKVVGEVTMSTFPLLSSCSLDFQSVGSIRGTRLAPTQQENPLALPPADHPPLAVSHSLP